VAPAFKKSWRKQGGRGRDIIDKCRKERFDLRKKFKTKKEKGGEKKTATLIVMQAFMRR